MKHYLLGISLSNFCYSFKRHSITSIFTQKRQQSPHKQYQLAECPSILLIFFIIILLMEQNHQERYSRLNHHNVILPFRRYKTMRNNSLPDLSELQHHSPRAEGSFQYNKWYIKPEQRLKKKLETQRSEMELQSGNRYFYESLYQGSDKQSGKNLKDTKEKENALRKICADSQNLKLLTTFRNRKQQHSKRVPAVIDYIINFNKKLEKEPRGSLIKKSKFFY